MCGDVLIFYSGIFPMIDFMYNSEYHRNDYND